MKAQPKKVPAKAAKKPAAKGKPPSKPAKAAAKKAPAKKAAAKKTAPKAPSKKSTTKAPIKKSPARAPVKAAAKPAAKKPAPAKPAAKAAPAKTTPKASSKAPATAPVKAPARAAAPAMPSQAARASKPSTRSGAAGSPPAAQNVAPAMAKASYTNTMSPVLNPPPLVAVKKDPKLAHNWKSKSAEDLSDAEILAMPDSEYMNDKQMAFFRLKLITLKTEILNSAGETTEHLREDTVIVPDPADRATIEEEHALELRTRDRERKLLKKIEQSIGRIDAGDYGYCDETGEPIGVARLLARPTATLSLEAQQRRELKQKMFGD